MPSRLFSLSAAALLLLISTTPQTAHSQAAPGVTFTSLYAFGDYPASGVGPKDALIQDSEGNLYGATGGKGPKGHGGIYKITPSGQFGLVCAFTEKLSGRTGNLVLGDDGQIYGTTGVGAHFINSGTVFKVDPASGTLTTLHTFNDATDGANPGGSLIKGDDGTFYGVTAYGGPSGHGTLFNVAPDGTYNTLHILYADDGSAGYSGIVPGKDGNFYGVTGSGGANKCGTVFRLTPSGSLTPLYSFTNGNDAMKTLTAGSDGSFYGTTYNGGAQDAGTLFKVTPSGAYTLLHSFAGADGQNPMGALIQGTDGNLYGTTSFGANHGGTVFRITPAGALTTLYQFHSNDDPANSDGTIPETALLEARDGSLYGTTDQGRTGNSGSIFKLTVPDLMRSAPAYQMPAGNSPAP